MKRLPLVLATAFVLAGGVWFVTQQSSRSQAPKSEDRAGTSAPSSPAGGAEPSTPAAMGERTELPGDVPKTANAASNGKNEPPLDEAAREALQWQAEYGTADDARLALLAEKIGALVAEERVRLFGEPEIAARAERAWVDMELQDADVEERLARPGLVLVARFLELDKPSLKSQFELIYLSPEEVPDLAHAKRQIAWFKSRIGTVR